MKGMRLFVAALAVLILAVFLRSIAGLSSPRFTGSSARKAVLVELFTSEGCSSCPPADALLVKLRQDLAKEGFDVIPLGFHVDYWNSLGWQDRFSSPEFSRRQEQYARALGTDGPYTPQLIIDGRTEFVGSDRARAYAAIAEAAGRLPAADIGLSISTNGNLIIKATSAREGALVLLAITEDGLVTKVGAGENNGRELRHSAVVRELRRLGTIKNGSFGLSVPLVLQKDWKPNDLRAVVLVQQSSAGEVLGAASVPLHAEQR